MKTSNADDLSATTDEQPYTVLTKKILKDFLFNLRHNEHPIFALFSHAPADQFAIVRYLDFRHTKNACGFRAQVDCYTVPEFYKNAASFHNCDGFRIVFGKNILHFAEELTNGGVERLYEEYLQDLCEMGLRTNKPIRLTRKLITKYGLTRNDVRVVRLCLADYNVTAQSKIQAEYDILNMLNCVKK